MLRLRKTSKTNNTSLDLINSFLSTPLSPAQATRLESLVMSTLMYKGEALAKNCYTATAGTSNAWAAINQQLAILTSDAPVYTKIRICGITVNAHTIRRAKAYDVFTLPMVEALQEFAIARLLPTKALMEVLLRNVTGSIVTIESDAYAEFAVEHAARVRANYKQGLPIASGLSSTVRADKLGLAYVDIDADAYADLPATITCGSVTKVCSNIMQRFVDRGICYRAAVSPSGIPKAIIPVKNIPATFPKRSDWLVARFHPSVGAKIDTAGVGQLFITPETFGEMLLGSLNVVTEPFVDYTSPLHVRSRAYQAAKEVEAHKKAAIVRKAKEAKTASGSPARLFKFQRDTSDVSLAAKRVKDRVESGNIRDIAVYQGAVLPPEVVKVLTPETLQSIRHLCKDTARAWKKLLTKETGKISRITDTGLLYLAMFSQDFLNANIVPNQQSVMDTLPILCGTASVCGVISSRKSVTNTLYTLFHMGAVAITNYDKKGYRGGKYWSPDYQLRDNAPGAMVRHFLEQCYFIIQGTSFSPVEGLAPAWQRIFVKSAAVTGSRGNMHLTRLYVSRFLHTSDFTSIVREVLDRCTGVIDRPYIYKQAYDMVGYVNCDRRRHAPHLPFVTTAEAASAAEYVSALYGR